MGKLRDVFDAFISNYYVPPTKEQKKGDNPYTRSGLPPPKLQLKHPDKNIQDENNRMNLRIHLDSERERTRWGMSKPEREWRKKNLLDQRLHPDEPIHVEAMRRQLNPVRRFYRYPLDKLYVTTLEPKMGPYYATIVRAVVPKAAIAVFGICVVYYHLKYEPKTWTQFHGTHVVPRQYDFMNLPEIEKEYPGLYDKAVNPPKKKQDFYNFKFQQRPYLRDLGETQRPW